MPDVVIVPMVGFDAGCNRLGYGGGFYDRTLAGLGDALVGRPCTSRRRSCPEDPARGDWDVTLPWIVIATETGVYRDRPAGLGIAR